MKIFATVPEAFGNEKNLKCARMVHHLAAIRKQAFAWGHGHRSSESSLEMRKLRLFGRLQ
jgi:hypothetical protein